MCGPDGREGVEFTEFIDHEGYHIIPISGKDQLVRSARVTCMPH